MLPISTPMRPNRPHIPSFIINVKERGHKKHRAANLLAHPAALPPGSLSAKPALRFTVSSFAFQRLPLR
jgi:hypothetical protein